MKRKYSMNFITILCCICIVSLSHNTFSQGVPGQDIIERTIAVCDTITDGTYTMLLNKTLLDDTKLSRRITAFLLNAGEGKKDCAYRFHIHETAETPATEFTYAYPFIRHYIHSKRMIEIVDIEKYGSNYLFMKSMGDYILEPVSKLRHIAIPVDADGPPQPYNGDFLRTFREGTYEITSYRDSIAGGAEYALISFINTSAKPGVESYGVLGINKYDFIPCIYRSTVIIDNVGTQKTSMTLESYDFTSTVFVDSLIVPVYGYDSSMFSMANSSTEDKIIARIPAWSGRDTALNVFESEMNHCASVLYYFSYSSCIPCRKSTPFINKIFETYRDAGLCVVYVNPYDKDVVHLKNYIDKYEIPYPVIMVDDDVAKSFEISGYPTFILADKSGKVIQKIRGYESKSTISILNKSINNMLYK